jgi:hypothetical protein
MLEFAIVPHKQLRNPRRIGAASQILEQHRIINIGQRLVCKAEPRRQRSADSAGAQTMTSGLAFG